MDRLITILRAAHCRSTHQFFVVDALPMVTTLDGQHLATQLLRHYKRYLIGAKAPDTEFKDFRNHVLHVHDNHWGGAPKKAEEWYKHFVRKIREGEWSDAAYCAGVLSHYFTDPLMPLHTQQSEQEAVIHRPLEFSVTKSYDRILQRFKEGRHKVVVQIANKDDWLSDAIIKGAELSNRYYDLLIDRYDLQAGAIQPEAGFDDSSIDVLAGLFGVALTGWAKIIEMAAKESNVQIPEAPLSLTELVASISMPVAWVVRRIASKSEQKAVLALFNEYQQTGTVVENLPAEVVSVTEERKRDRRLEQDRAGATVKARTIQPLQPNSPQSVEPPQAPQAPKAPTATVPFTDPSSQPTPTESSLSLTDDLVDAPSIGTKTAARFAAIGVTTVAQFLAGNPEKLSRAINARWIKPETIVDWQDQARLVMAIPELCAYKAQLLVGVDCRHKADLAKQNAKALHAQLATFAGTSNGKRVLRSNRLPTVEDVGSWIRSAADDSLKRTA
jgi:predicted flap endonuclease-1-like 5' DNA nuclease